MTDLSYRPVSPEPLAEEIADRILGLPGPWARVAFDGADEATSPGQLADAVSELLRLRGRQTLRVSGRDYLRPASLRFERGREDPDTRYYDWLDERGLRREVLDPLGPGGSGLALPALWDTERDRATRAHRVTLPPGSVVLVDGELLLGRGLPFDLTVHLWLSPGALRRRVPADAQWALPAYTRYEEEAAPISYADLVVRMDDPRHPALIERV